MGIVVEGEGKPQRVKLACPHCPLSISAMSEKSVKTSMDFHIEKAHAKEQTSAV